MKEILNRSLARGLGYCAEKASLWVCATHDLGKARLDIDASWNVVDKLEEEAAIDKFELNK